jgi:hypothetical protein
MTLDEAITHGEEQLEIFGGEHAEFINVAIRALGMQKKLAKFHGADICYWNEVYEFDDEGISEYEYEASVDNFLIDEAKGGKEDLQNFLAELDKKNCETKKGGE